MVYKCFEWKAIGYLVSKLARKLGNHAYFCASINKGIIYRFHLSFNADLPFTSL